MVRKRCGMGSIDALTLWKWRISFVVEWTLLLENRMESLFTVCVACLIVTSCDVESIDEFVCERKWSVDSVVYSYSPPITWVWERNHVNLLFLGFSIPIHSASLLYHLHRLALESHNCNHHHSFSFLINTKQSLSNPSPQTHQLNSFQFITMIPLQSNSPFFDTCFPSLHHAMIHFDVQSHTQINNSELEWMPFLFHFVFSITLLPMQS